MNTRSIIVAAIGGAALVAIPTTVAVAMNSSDDGRPSMGWHSDDAPGRGDDTRRGMGVHDGLGDPAALVADGATLTSTDETSLDFMVQEEKLAHDLYAEFADAWGLRLFDNISSAEQQHMDSVGALLDAYGVDDPTDGLASGEFANLESGSENHLRAFVLNLDRAGVDYPARILSDSEVSRITGR